MRNVIIAVDFDGTLCKDKYPGIGEANVKLIEFLKCMIDFGSKVILWTCRCGDRLKEAVEWCNDKGLKFAAVNENLPEAIKEFGSDSRKIFADYYIDDKMWSVPHIPFKY